MFQAFIDPAPPVPSQLPLRCPLVLHAFGHQCELLHWERRVRQVVNPSATFLHQRHCRSDVPDFAIMVQHSVQKANGSVCQVQGSAALSPES